MKSFIVLTILFYLLVLIQIGFLVPLNVFGLTPNLVLIFLIIFAVLEEKGKNLSLAMALLAGFFTDVFSSLPIGTTIIIFLLLAFILKRVIPLIKELDLFWLFILFFFSVVFYNLLMTFIPFLLSLSSLRSDFFQINIKKQFFIEIILNLLTGLITFYIISLAKRYVWRFFKKGA